ncbi:MAG: 30S ribosomal protein S2 [Candidatus Falkowbacteria bacterium]|nr:30S ribosomal protein S2 [Candidatus Falkowbacteria bacterium]
MKDAKSKVSLPSVQEMLEAGMHFGHRTYKWHPKMKPYIFEARKGIHIIDLQKTLLKLEDALTFMSRSIAEGKTILMVGTKNQVKTHLKEMAQEAGVAYVVERWLGGTLTNFNIIRNSIRAYQDLLEKKESGKLEKYTKKERIQFDRRIKKLSASVGGLITLNRTPDIIFIWDIKHEETALAEAKKRRIPIIAVCDTNVNPQGIEYIIPSNDDASKAVTLVLGLIKDTVIEARNNAKEAKEKAIVSNKE